MSNKEFRQTSLSEYKLCNPSLGNITKLMKSNAHIVKGKSQWLSMEITTGHNKIHFREYSGIIRDRVYFCMKNISHVIHGILNGTMHLRNTSEGIRILHMLFFPGYNLAAFKQGAEYHTCLNLSFVRSNLLYTVEEWLYSSVKSLKRHSTEQIETIHKMPPVDQCLYAIGTHKLSSVKQCKSLF